MKSKKKYKLVKCAWGGEKHSFAGDSFISKKKAG